MKPIRVVVCWAEVSGYMAACWRALAARDGIDLHVVHLESLTGQPTPFDVDRVMEGIPNRRFRRSDPISTQFLRSEVSAHQPDVVVLCGWIYWPYTRLLFAPELAQSRASFSAWTRRGSDRSGSAWRDCGWATSCRASILSSRRANGPPNMRARIGVPASRIQRRLLWLRLRCICEGATARPTTAAAIPVCRPVCRRQRPSDAGAGIPGVSRSREQSLAADLPGHRSGCALLRNQPGITDAGFMQPAQLPQAFRDHGVFVLPSRYEPWGVVIAEAAASGLAVICSDACGAAEISSGPRQNGHRDSSRRCRRRSRTRCSGCTTTKRSCPSLGSHGR